MFIQKKKVIVAFLSLFLTRIWNEDPGKATNDERGTPVESCTELNGS